MDTPEYKTLEQCYPSLVSSVQQSPGDVHDQLIPYGILAPEDMSFLNNRSNSDKEKARKIINAVQYQVLRDPQKFFSFIKALKSAGEWIKGTVIILEQTHATMSAEPEHQKNQEVSPLSTHTSEDMSPADTNPTDCDEIDKLDISKLPAELQSLELEKLKIVYSKTKSIAILLTGKTGSGKSTLTNAILGCKVRGEGPAKEGHDLSPCTQEVDIYVCRKGNMQVTVWDSPGLQDGTENQMEYLKQIKEKCHERDLTMYCVNISERRLDYGDVQVMKKLTSTFGINFWSNTIIVLTFVNTLNAFNVGCQCLSPGDKAREGTKKIKQWQNQIQAILINDIRVPEEIVRAIRIIQAGHYMTPHLPEYPFWLPALWFYCINEMQTHEIKKTHKSVVPKLDTYKETAKPSPLKPKSSHMLESTYHKVKQISQAKPSIPAKSTPEQIRAMVGKSILHVPAEPSDQSKRISCANSLNILVTGRTGVGKSTLINGLFRCKILHVGGPLFSENYHNVKGQATVNNIDLTVWRNSELQDGMYNDNKEYLHLAVECRERDLTIYCIKASSVRFARGDDNPEILAMKKLTHLFGNEFWSNSIIVLTFANGIESSLGWRDLSKDEIHKAFLARLQKWEELIRVCMIEDVRVPTKIVQAIRIVPAGHYKKPHLPGYENWLSHMILQCYETISKPDAQAAFMKATSAKILADRPRTPKPQQAAAKPCTYI